MTAIPSGPALIAALPAESAGRPAADGVAAGETEQLDSFMALLQQAAAVVPQALQVIREELPGDSSGVGSQSMSPAGATDADQLLAQLGAAFTLQGTSHGQGDAAGVSNIQEALAAAGSAALTKSLDAVSLATQSLPAESPSVTGADAPMPLLPPAPSSSQDGGAALASPHRPVHAPVGSQEWAEEIGARLSVLGARGEQTASLRLSPEHLGPLEVRITIQDDKASVWFGAAHAQTREAIEQALPRLREMLQSQGLALDEAGVFDDSPSQQSAAGDSGGSAADTAEEEAQQTLRYRGLLDLYA